MKLKGISTIERHVEKIVLGLFAAFLLVVLLIQAQLLGPKTIVKVGSRDVPMAQALDVVKESALQRRAALEGKEVIAGVPSDLPSPLEKFREATTLAAAPVTTLAAMGPRGLNTDDSGAVVAAPIEVSGDRPFVTTPPPAPATPMVHVYEGTIDPLDVQRIGPALANLLPPQQPFDVRAVSIQTTFDAAALRSAFITAASDGSAQGLPPSLWRQRVELVDVVWERQSRDSSGQWSDPVELAPAPGRASVRDVIAKPDFQPGDFKTIQDTEQAKRLEIRRPEFYATIAGPNWVWPAMARERDATDSGEKAARKVRELREIRQTIENVERQMNAPGRNPGQPGRRAPGANPPPGGGPGGNPPAPPPPPGRDPRSQAPAAPGSDLASAPPASEDDAPWPHIPLNVMAQAGPGRPGGGGGADRPADSGADRERDQREALTKRLTSLRADETRVLGELAALGYDPEGRRIESVARFDEAIGSITSDDTKTVTLWTHDLTATPGTEHRYRARVRLTSPFYGRNNSLRPDQQSLAEVPIIESSPSEWSEPVRVLPGTIFFVTNATAAGGPLASPPRAGVEIFEFFYGYWRRAEVALLPGDPVAQRVTLPDGLATFLLTPEPPEARPGLAPPPAQREPIDRERTLVVPAFFIDTAPTTAGRAQTAAVFSGQNGLESFAPSDPAWAAERDRLAASARAAASATLRAPGAPAPGLADPSRPLDPANPDNPDEPGSPSLPGTPSQPRRR